MGWSYPGSERTLEILRSRSQLEALCFFRETQIIKEDIILGSSVMYLLEFILQAVFYGKYLPKLSIDVLVLLDVQSHQCPECN